MGAATNLVSEPADRVLVITRMFDAPRSAVFKAWTESDQMAQWFGPRSFESKVLKNDPRTGGAFRIYMRGPSGDDHWTQGVYHEFVAPERLVMDWGWADADGNPTRPRTTLTVNFEDVEGKTRLTLHQAVFESVAARDDHQGGWNSSFDCLAEFLAALR